MAEPTAAASTSASETIAVAASHALQPTASASASAVSAAVSAIDQKITALLETIEYLKRVYNLQVLQDQKVFWGKKLEDAQKELAQLEQQKA